MNKLTKKLVTAAATGALLFNTVMPAFAGVTLEISGNGSDTENEISFEQENEVEVNQSNYADVLNEVKVEANTGDNEAEDNTGGDVEIDTGDSETTVTVVNSLNTNVAKVDSCCTGDVEAKISDNGTDSENELELELENETKVNQYNDAEVFNYVDVEAETGDNEAEDNTGGDVTIKTGSADATVKVGTVANFNSAMVSGDGDGGSLTAVISGNGSDTKNEIELELENEVKLNQSNYADILNDVEIESETGDNEAEDNTGGEVEIDTGDTSADVTVDNMANFNWADIDGCGCVEDITAKISGNGTDSENEIEAELESEKEVDQYNDFDCKGELKDACAEVDIELESGDNEAEDNTMGGDDPTIETGDADATVTVENSANSNVYGGVPEWELPELFEGFSLNITLDWGDLLNFLGL